MQKYKKIKIWIENKKEHKKYKIPVRQLLDEIIDDQHIFIDQTSCV